MLKLRKRYNILSHVSLQLIFAQMQVEFVYSGVPRRRKQIEKAFHVNSLKMVLNLEQETISTKLWAVLLRQPCVKSNAKGQHDLILLTSSAHA